jgi:hypothetical protein
LIYVCNLDTFVQISGHDIYKKGVKRGLKAIGKMAKEVQMGQRK